MVVAVLVVCFLSSVLPSFSFRLLGMGVQVLTIVHVIAGTLALLSFGSLCCFHLYLQALGMGTYDWILANNPPVNNNNNNNTQNHNPRFQRQSSGFGSNSSSGPPGPPKAAKKEVELTSVVIPRSEKAPSANGSSTTLGSISTTAEVTGSGGAGDTNV